jgi:hypothetical protein
VHYPPGSGHRRSGDQRGLLTVGQQPAVARPLAWWWGCNWPTSLVLLPWGLTTASRWGRGAAPATDPPGSSRCAAGPAATGRRSPAGPDQPIGHLGWLGRAISAGEKPHPPQCLPTEDGPQVVLPGRHRTLPPGGDRRPDPLLRTTLIRQSIDIPDKLPHHPLLAPIVRVAGLAGQQRSRPCTMPPRSESAADSRPVVLTSRR